MADNAEIIVADALKYGSNENNFKDLEYIRFVYIALGSLSELEKNLYDLVKKESLDNMKTLVTGCAGFIGSHLTERLLS